MRPERRNLRSGRARAGVRFSGGAAADHPPYQLGERLVARFFPEVVRNLHADVGRNVVAIQM